MTKPSPPTDTTVAITETSEITNGPETTIAPESTSAPDTTSAPETTNVPENTSTPEATKVSETTSAPETTKVPETTSAPETTEAPHVHAWSSWTTTLNATCTAEGKQERTCSCGEKEIKSTSALGHNVVIDKAVPATCTTVGKTEGKHCSVCNIVLVEQTSLNLVDHTYNDDKDENCNVCGFIRDVSCKHTDTVILSAKAPTCTGVGLTEGKKCSDCGEITVKQEIVNALGHTEVIDKAVAATCTTDGKTEGKHCSVCNAIIVKQNKINALGHTEIIDAAISATCTTQGKTEGKHCSVCKAVLVAQKSVSITDHNYGEWKTTKAATCTVKGTQERTCACGKKEYQSIDALGHTEVIDKAIPATCTEYGKTEGKHCSVCNTVFVKQKQANKIAHIKGDWITDKEPTCTTTGSAHIECTMCGKNMQNKTLAKTAHTESNWIIDREATCKAAGSQHIECLTCKKKIKTESIAKNDNHAGLVIDAGVAPTCGRTGLTEGKHCTSCKTMVLEQQTLEATGKHKYDGNFCSGCGKKSPDFEFPSGYITTEPIEIETEYCILKIEENMYVTPGVAEKVDTVCRALEAVTGLKFKNDTYGKDKVIIHVTKGDMSFDWTGEADVTFNAYTLDLSREIYVPQAGLFINYYNSLVHELAHALHFSQTKWRTDKLTIEGFAEYAQYLALNYLAEHHINILYPMSSANNKIHTYEYPEDKKVELYSQKLEHWFQTPFVYDPAEPTRADYALGFRFMWYLDAVYSDYTQWILFRESANPSINNHHIDLSLDEQFAELKQIYGEDVLEGFYLWLQKNEDIFNPNLLPQNPKYTYDLTDIEYINLYPAFYPSASFIDIRSIKYNDLYINLEELKKYLSDYKGRFIDYMRFTCTGSATFYDKDGNILWDYPHNHGWFDKNVSYIRLNGSGSLNNPSITVFANFAENGLAYKTYEKRSYCGFQFLYDVTDSHLLVPSNANSIPVKIIENSATENEFEELKQIIEITVSEGIELIKQSAFKNCINVKRINLPSSLKELERYIWKGENIDIYYAGTYEEWEAIEKHERWGYFIKGYTLHCSDGIVIKGNQE